MTKHRRTYLPKFYGFNPGREVVLEDLGTYFKISGLLMEGMGTAVVLMLPSSEAEELKPLLRRPTLEEWGEIIARTDDPFIFVGAEGTLRKILHRKAQFQISGAVQQKIWARDNFRCIYCGRQMGGSENTLLTVDHFVPLELGGVNDETNYLSCCRKCNKRKGNLPPEEFCRQEEAREPAALTRDPGGLYRRVSNYLRNVNVRNSTRNSNG